MCSNVHNYLLELSSFLIARSLKLSPVSHIISVDDVKIPTMNKLNILDVTFDSLHSFTPHTTAIITKVQSRNTIFKSLARSFWSRPVINYVAPIGPTGCRWK